MHPDETAIEAGESEKEFQTLEGREVDRFISDVKTLADKHNLSVEQVTMLAVLLRNTRTTDNPVAWPGWF